MHCSKQRSLFDHLVSDGKQARRNGETERLRGREIDDELKLGRLHDRKVGRLFALEDTAGVNAGLMKRVGDCVSIFYSTWGNEAFIRRVPPREGCHLPLNCCRATDDPANHLPRHSARTDDPR
jgi:hypothetical protein